MTGIDCRVQDDEGQECGRKTVYWNGRRNYCLEHALERLRERGFRKLPGLFNAVNYAMKRQQPVGNTCYCGQRNGLMTCAYPTCGGRPKQ